MKLLDFGISKAGLKKGSRTSISAENAQIMGSPHYMSPEQIRSTKDVDARADVWSLGVVALRLVTGKTPFEAARSRESSRACSTSRTTATWIMPDLPVGFEAIIGRCLEKDASKRFQTAADLAQALQVRAPAVARDR